jgi:hypothetical protein
MLHRPAWGLILRRKPWFWLFQFGPFFRDHDLIVIAQNVALRSRRRRQRRGKKNHSRKLMARMDMRCQSPHQDRRMRAKQFPANRLMLIRAVT